MRRAFPNLERPYHEHAGVWADEFRRDAKYENWRSQGTRDWLLIFTVSGTGWVGTASDEIRSDSGTLTLYEPGTSQFYYTDSEVGRWHLLWAHFHPPPHWVGWLRWDRVGEGLSAIHLRDAAYIRKIRGAMMEAIDGCRSHSFGSGELALNALERVLLLVRSFQPEADMDPRIRKAASLLLEQMAEPFSMSKLAAQSGLSVSRLTHLFSVQVGLPPQQYLESLRLRRAVHLLRSSNLSVAEVAEETGYANAFYFSNRFKKKYGSSPRAFRDLA